MFFFLDIVRKRFCKEKKVRFNVHCIRHVEVGRHVASQGRRAICLGYFKNLSSRL